MRRSCLLLLLMCLSALALLDSCMSCRVGPPQLWINATPLAGKPDLEVTFFAELKNLPGSPAYTAKSDGREYRWNFGDGTAGTGQTVTHTYTEPGYYEVCATHTTEDGIGTTAKVGIMVDSSDISVYPFQEWEDVEQATEILPSRLEVAFAPNTSLQEVQMLLADLPIQVVGWIEDLGVFEILLEFGTDSEGITNALLIIPQVEEVAPSYLAEPLTGTPTAVPDDIFYEQLQQGWNKLRVELGLDLAGTDQVKIAVVDSGYDTDHPELVGQVDEAWAYGLWGDMEDDSKNEKMFGHGTTVLGVMAAKEGNGWLRGIVPPQAYFIVIKVNRAWFTIAAGIRQAVKRGAHVINVTLGQRIGLAPGMRSACQNAYDNNCLVVAAAGNKGKPSLDYPARYDTVLGVGGTKLDDTWHEDSNYGSTAVYAPMELYTTRRGGTVGKELGTSISAPAVAGLAALIFSLDNTASVDDVRDVIEDTCDDIGFTGIGRVNFFRAMMKATGGGDPKENTLPPAVSKLEVIQLCTGGVQITWEHPASSDATGVRIYRITEYIGAPWVLHQVATVADTQGSASFIDSDVAQNVSYSYLVFAVDPDNQLSSSYKRDAVFVKEPLSWKATDPSGDWISPSPPSHRYPYMDIVETKISLTSSGQLRFEMKVAGDIPETPPGWQFYGWFLDTDLDNATGQPYNDIGSDFNAQIDYDPVLGWIGLLYKISDPGFRKEFTTIDVGDRSVTLEMPFSEIGSPDMFRWISIDQNGVPFYEDIVPNSGHIGPGW